MSFYCVAFELNDSTKQTNKCTKKIATFVHRKYYERNCLKKYRFGWECNTFESIGLEWNGSLDSFQLLCMLQLHKLNYF